MISLCRIFRFARPQNVYCSYCGALRGHPCVVCGTDKVVRYHHGAREFRSRMRYARKLFRETQAEERSKR